MTTQMPTIPELMKTVPGRKALWSLLNFSDVVSKNWNVLKASQSSAEQAQFPLASDYNELSGPAQQAADELPITNPAADRAKSEISRASKSAIRSVNNVLFLEGQDSSLALVWTPRLVQEVARERDAVLAGLQDFAPPTSLEIG